jgi:hypothetical protein
VLSDFIASKVREEWEKGMPICTEELLILFQRHVINTEDDEAINMFVEGKKNTIQKFIGRVLKKHKYSIHKNSIPQSVP